MKTLPLFDPILEFDRLFEVLGPAALRMQAPEGHTVPIDVLEVEGQWILRASLPGIKPEDIDVSIDNKVLTIRGKLDFAQEHADSKVYRREIATGSFVRSVRLPNDVDVDKVAATFENGFVTVMLPRVPESRPAAIKVPLLSASQEQ
ncbi:MAG: Hsp20/alpha crystallin family protein [Chthonomonadaceae bacterium]|nr:Hsp20/alpha crystallin family protein [Chthonomonadaceae bacterium]